MKTTDFRFLERLRVRWAEIDAQQIVFNAHYLTYFDTALAGYWRALAVPFVQTMALLDGELFVRKTTIEYHGSARYDDLLDIGVRCARVGNSSMVFDCGAFHQDRLLVSGELVYVFADPVSQTSKALPQPLREVLDGFEAGRSMISVKVGPWSELGSDARQIRSEVFVTEQNIPAELEWDDADRDCTHAVAFNGFGAALATGRLFQHVPGVAKIGRMAVRRALRGSGVGRAVLDALLQAARERGNREVVLHAQTSAAGFYHRAGFSERGPLFDEGGIRHVEMVRTL